MNRLRALRQSKGWTQAQLGKRLDLAKTTISGYEKEEHYLDPPTINKVCDLFGCTADYLLGRSDTSVPSVTPEQARLLKAYKDASDRDKGLVDHILGLDIPENKKDISAS